MHQGPEFFKPSLFGIVGRLGLHSRSANAFSKYSAGTPDLTDATSNLTVALLNSRCARMKSLDVSMILARFLAPTDEDRPSSP